MKALDGEFRCGPAKAAASLLPLLLAALPLGGMVACNLADDKESVNATDPFPRPIGSKMIPLEMEFDARFRFAGFDDAGVKREDLGNSLQLQVTRRGSYYAYAFESPDRGHLLTFKYYPEPDSGKFDSTGIYIVGTFHDTANTIDSNHILWLPQFPRKGVTWNLDSNRVMELVSADTGYWTEPLFYPSADTIAKPVNGFQRHPTYLFRETAGATVTYYHFRKGVGCVGFERAENGKLQAAGTLYTIYTTRR